MDGHGAVVARTRIPHRVGTPHVDALEHDVARAWRRGPRQAFAAVSSELDGAAAGVVVTSMVPSITALDRRGRPLLPGLLYGDARAGRPERCRPATGAGERDQGRRMLGWAVGRHPEARSATGIARPWPPMPSPASPPSTWPPPCPSATSTPGGGGIARCSLRWAWTSRSCRWWGQWAEGSARCRGRRPSSPEGRSTPSASSWWPVPTARATCWSSSGPPSSCGWSPIGGRTCRG